MLRQRRSPLRLIVAGALVAVGACGDQRQTTAPLAPSEAPSEANAGGGTRVKLKSLQLSANTLRIDGPGVTAAVEIGNPGLAIQSGISIRAEIAQPAARHRAFDVPTQCLPGDTPGFLPTGNCSMNIPATASNGAPGIGAFAPGAAEFIVRVLQTTGGTEVELATKSVTVNLVSTPAIASLTLASTTLAIDGPGTTWTASLQNPAKSLQGVLLQGYIVQGTTRRAAGGLQVSCGSATGVLPPGTCTINFATSASNAGSGTGALTPGAATFELNMIQSGAPSTTLDTKTVGITLVSSSPVISSLALDATTLVIGASVDYTVQLQNPGFQLDQIYLQGEMVQGSVTKGAGGFSVDCGNGLNILPTITTGSCTMRLTVIAGGDAIGGSFVPGPATFVLQLFKAPTQGDPIVYDTKTVQVTLLPNTPTLTSVVPATSYVPLGAGFSGYKAIVENPGQPATDVVLQGWIRQGSARRAAAGTQIRCSGGPGGMLPSGTCIALGDIVASNDPIVSGSGTLVLGPATFELELIVNGTIVDTKAAPITLVPSTTSIVRLDLESTTIQIGGSTRYHAVVYNPGISSVSGALLQGYITQGSVESGAGGVVTSCAANGVLPPGSCDVSFTVNPSNGGASNGNLVAGGAQFVLKLFINNVVQDEKSVQITLTVP